MDLKAVVARLATNKFANKYFISTTYPIYLKYKHKYLRYRRLKYFHAHALDVLKDFDIALKSINVPYTLAFGTLLGAVREHGFIPHDDDIDTIIWIDDYSDNIAKALKQFGFKLEHFFEVDNKKFGYEETYSKDGIIVDIFYFFKGERLPYCCWFVWPESVSSFSESMKVLGYVSVNTIELPLNRQTIDVDFKGLRLPIPINYDEILRMRYGDDYMTPMPDWHSNGDNPYIVFRKDKKGTYCLS